MKRPVVLAAMAIISIAPMPAHAHSWYPRECCSGEDCAPVERIERLPDSGRWLITSKHGKAILGQTLPLRESQDGRAHVCMRSDEFGAIYIVCFFAPRSM